jgi:putative endonuclease
VLECRNGSLYTGISTDSARRFQQHLAGTAARYTRAFPPLKILATLTLPSRSAALKGEYAIKQLSPAAKRQLCRRIASGKVQAADLDDELLALRG